MHLWPESCANAIGNSNSSRRCLRLPKVQPENFPIQCARTEFHCPNGPRLDSRYWKSSVQHQPKFSQFDGNRRQWVISSMKTLRNNQWFESCLWLFFNTSVTNWPNNGSGLAYRSEVIRNTSTGIPTVQFSALCSNAIASEQSPHSRWGRRGVGSSPDDPSKVLGSCLTFFSCKLTLPTQCPLFRNHMKCRT